MNRLRRSLNCGFVAKKSGQQITARAVHLCIILSNKRKREMIQCCLALNWEETWKYYMVTDCYVRERYQLLHLRGRVSLKLTLVEHSVEQTSKVRTTFVLEEGFRDPFYTNHTFHTARVELHGRHRNVLQCSAPIFTSQRVYIARTMPWQDVCPSVRPSVCLSVRHTPVLCLNGYTYPQHFFTVG